VPGPPPPGAATPSTPARPVPPGGAPARGKAQGFVFNFDNADLYEVIRTIAEVLKISYVIDPRVKGVVNIHVTGPVAQEDVYPIFLSILRMNGATVVKKDSLYEIVPFGDGKRLPAPLDMRTPTEDRFSIEVIKPRFIPISELEKVVKPFLSDEKEIIPFPQNNVLIVSDLASNIRKIRDIIALFDTDIFTDTTIRIYPISNSDATEMAKDLEKIFASFGISSKEAKGGGITFTPITRANSILVVSSIPGILEKVENWIKELDKAPAEESKAGVHIYYVQNTKAKDLAEVLKSVYTKSKEAPKKAEEPKRETPTPPTGTTPRTTRDTQRTPEASRTPYTPPTPPATAAPPRGTSTEEGGKIAEGEINIVVDETNNALVIRAIQRDYRAVLETIKKLDVYPKQVLIEVFLAEITLDDNSRYGVEWARFVDTWGAKDRFTNEVIWGSTPPANPLNQDLSKLSNMKFGIVDAAGKFAYAINLAASEGRLNVISSPHILASNNKEAKIQIGQEQPILTSTYRPTYDTGATTTNSYLEGSIEYKDIGIIMTVTPRISDSGLISLEIQLEKSDVGTTTLGNLQDVPFFPKKTAKTTASLLEGQTIVIGGLIEDTKNIIKSGVPWFYKLPIIGPLFGVHTTVKKKTETIMLMTPHIITDNVTSKAVTEEFKQKLEGIRKDIEERERRKLIK
jgi:general secretion pathway protein D